MALIKPTDLVRQTPLKRLGFLGKPIAHGLYRMLSLDDINALYQRNEQYESPEFEAKLLKDLGVNYEVSEQDLNRIPATGAFVIVSNHPLGALDGIIMLKMISEVRPDFKIIANFLLHLIDPLKPKIYAVNPFESRKDLKNSTSGMMQAYRHLKSGHPLGVFPAGEVSRKNEQDEVVDRDWQLPVIKLIQKADVPVIPLYFNAKNSPWFYRLGKLHPDLQTALLPKELLRTRKKPIKIRIGKPISPTQLQKFESTEDLATFLYKKTHLLSATYAVPDSIPKQIKKKIPRIRKKMKPLIPEVDKSLIIPEIDKLYGKEDACLFEHGAYDCFFVKSAEIPNTMREITRLREITFRAVGEGTGKSRDTDAYDDYYHHLILWDRVEQRLVGAYRMGLGRDIFAQKGVKGFYVSELFDFDREIEPLLASSIEMGRAWVHPDYQLKPFPLFLLWRGIVHVCLRNPEHQFIMGGVSISNQFSDFSKKLMIEFMRSHYYDSYLAQFVRAKKEFKTKLKEFDMDFILQETQADLNKFDRLIEEFEQNSMRLPVLIKKYIKQNAKVIGFNVDPNFNDAIDGLMYIKISDIPQSTLKPVLDELQQALQSKIEVPTTTEE
ncbi:MAG: lysophospholipid acyltransferase family protein [Weeksellaceae bacterium]|nr:lysophospholipid acyltransferase family protein [Weeksellaceae bacterium]